MKFLKLQKIPLVIFIGLIGFSILSTLYTLSPYYRLSHVPYDIHYFLSAPFFIIVIFARSIQIIIISTFLSPDTKIYDNFFFLAGSIVYVTGIFIIAKIMDTYLFGKRRIW